MSMKEKSKKNFLTIYGQNNIWRKYTSLPDNIPLLCYYPHGVVTPEEKIYPDELCLAKYLILALNKKRAEAWKKLSHLPVVITGSPFVHYRRMNNIIQDKDAKGTIVYPAHACDCGGQVYDIQSFCDLLENLPEEFKPVTVSVFIDDMKRGDDKIYRDRGFNTVTSGEIYSPDFPANFYKILKKHKYSISNQIGSQVFYAVEMGIPHFLIGAPPLVKVSKPSISRPPGLFYINKLYFSRKIYNLVPKEPVDYISAELREYVLEAVGVNDCISPEELRELLIQTYKKHRLEHFFNTNIKGFLRKNFRTPYRYYENKIKPLFTKKDKAAEECYGIPLSRRVKFWYELCPNEEVKYDFNLNQDSVVFDVGGYEGDWAEKIHSKYGSNLHIFEPVPDFITKIIDKFTGEPKITINNCGLAGSTRKENISFEADSSSVCKENENRILIKLKDVNEYIKENNIEEIDLMKINIEGGEYELLEYMIENNLIKKVKNLLVQFHHFVPNAKERMFSIYKKLELSHEQTFQVEFVWETWKRKDY